MVLAYKARESFQRRHGVLGTGSQFRQTEMILRSSGYGSNSRWPIPGVLVLGSVASVSCIGI